jgi:hypothetical protein
LRNQSRTSNWLHLPATTAKRAPRKAWLAVRIARGDVPVGFALVTISGQPIQYKGDELDPERGPGLGCFRFQLAVLAILVVLTPLTVAWGWPTWVSTVLLVAVIVLLLVTGQTIIFLLRLVAADRRGRRRPLASATKTVGELDDAAQGSSAPSGGDDRQDPSSDPPSDEGPVRQ